MGGLRGPLVPAVGEYEDGARRYWKFEVVEVSAGGRGGTPSPSAVKDAEAERILAKIPADFEVVALTLAG